MRRTITAVAAMMAAVLFQGCASAYKDFNPKSDGRWARLAVSLPLTPFVYGWMGYHILTEERGPHEVSFEHAVRYDPLPANEGGRLDSAQSALLSRFTPIIVQQIDPEAAYDPSFNQIGRPLPLRTLGGDKYVSVDVNQPSVFGFITEAEIAGAQRTQTNYVYWFPEHPSLGGGFDPEAGKIEGITLRITLDAEDKPLFYETVFNCGCYHRAYPSEVVEENARQEFGGPLPGKFTSVAKPTRFRIDLYASEAVKLPAGERPVIFSSAGNHQPLHIGSQSEIPILAPSIAEQRISQLRPYDELTVGGADGLGIFGRDKLVVGSDRPEAKMLFPTGLYHAGTPRRRGSQLIHFDQYDFDDPRLLEKHLRIPSGI
jgi:hypothetical protein